LQKLLVECFPDYPTENIFFNKSPQFRLLAKSGNQLVGQIGVEFRVINNDGQIARTFCISDVCVLESFRSKQIASQMLLRIEELGRKNNVAFLILTTSRKSLYYKLGYRGKSNTFKWFMIQNNRSLGIANRSLGSDTIMVKSISNQKWGKGEIDLLGPIF